VAVNIPETIISTKRLMDDLGFDHGMALVRRNLCIRITVAHKTKRGPEICLIASAQASCRLFSSEDLSQVNSSLLIGVRRDKESDEKPWFLNSSVDTASWALEQEPISLMSAFVDASTETATHRSLVRRLPGGCRIENGSGGAQFFIGRAKKVRPAPEERHLIEKRVLCRS
jgi:hypothetical protein